jgi:hydroxypyruvate isomerase
MLFTELPFVERVRAIHERGLGVEIWNWTTKDLDELAATGANFTSMTGYIEGDLLEEDGIARFLETAEQSIVASRIIDADRLNVHGTGLDGDGQAIRPRESVTAAERSTAASPFRLRAARPTSTANCPARKAAQPSPISPGAFGAG